MKITRPSPTLSKIMTTGNPCTPSADSQWSPVGNWECPQYHLQRMRRTPPMPEEQRPKPNTTVTNSSGQEWESKALHGKYPQRVKQAERWRRQDHQMAKSSWPHRCPRSKPPSQLVPTQHSLEAWRGPLMQTMWPFRRDHWHSGLC